LFIYGSFAKANAGLKNYIDLFIVGGINENELIPLVHENEQVFHHEITFTLMWPGESGQRKREGEPFETNVTTGPKGMITSTWND
jgi:hypothetical protein